MIKKLSILSILLLAFTAMANQTPINLQDDALEKSQQNIELMEKICTSITQNCDPKQMEAHEKSLLATIDTYLESCLQDKAKAHKTQDLETQANNLLQYLLSETKQDEAYAIASMIFMINWSKHINEIAVKIEDSQKAENLQEAIEKVSAMVEKIFLEPMAKLLEENQSE